MSDPKIEVSRAAKSSTTTQKVKLSKINVSDEHDFCHRDKNKYGADNSIASLADSIVSEGLQTPLTVAECKTKEDVENYILVGGHRRVAAIRKIIRENLDADRFHPEMEIDVVVVRREASQSEREFNEDLFFKSIADNALRNDFTEDERLEIVRRCHDQKVPTPRAARALGLSEKQYQRIASVVTEPWLLEMVLENVLAMTHAQKLLEAANKNPPQFEKNKRNLQDFLREWSSSKRAILEHQIAQAKKIKRPLSGSNATVKKFVTPQLLTAWIQAIHNGTKLSDKAIVEFGIHVDEKEGKIVVPAIEFRVKEGEPETLKQMIVEFQRAAEDATVLFEQVNYLKFLANPTPEEKKRKAEELRKECDEESRRLEQHEAGRRREVDEFDDNRTLPSELDVTDDDSTDPPSKQSQTGSLETDFNEGEEAE